MSKQSGLKIYLKKLSSKCAWNNTMKKHKRKEIVHFSLWSVFWACDLVFIKLEIFPKIPSCIMRWICINKSEHSTNSHLVCSKRASFIRTNNAGASQGFNRGQRAHDGIFARHATGTQGKTSSYYSRKTLWYCSNSQSNSNFEIVNGPTYPRSTMGRIVEMTNINYPYSDANECNNLKWRKIKSNSKKPYFWQLLSKFIQFLS